MIEKIYKHKGKTQFMFECDNCGEGGEVETWVDALEYMMENEWKKKQVKGQWLHYCKDCKE
jgi:diphthamide synthase (EF-2-diphthine--ammonia ligase)